MSEQVISLTSSDEEDNPEPPPKKKKLTPVIVPQVTLTLVTNIKKKGKIETVTLDSDDELDETSNNEPKAILTNLKSNGKLKNASNENLDCITLTDDEEDIVPRVTEVNTMIASILGSDCRKSVTLIKKNGPGVQKDKAETVSLLDSDSDNDSDTETSEGKQSKPTEECCKESIDTNEHIVDKLVEEPVEEAEDKIVKETNEKETNEVSEKKDNEINENNVSDTNEAVNEDVVIETTKESQISVESAGSDEPVEEEAQRSVKNNSPSLTRVEASNDSIVIDDSDEETEKENHCENVDIEPFPVNLDKTTSADIPGPSVSSKVEFVEARTLFKKFLKIVEEKIVDSSFEEILPKKVPIIQKYFKRCNSYVSEKVFETLLNENIESVKKSPTSSAANTAVLAFHKIFEHLKSHVAESTIEIEEEHLPKVKKLEKTIKLLRKRIKQLEETEVNFDDDEDSAYIMLDRYQARLNKVYAKYCQYIRRNPFGGRAIYDKISFVNSKYNVINQAISRKYKNSVNFPSYYELEKYIHKISKKEKLELSDQEIKHESKKCFKYLGSILQKKRRQELYDSHLDFIEFTEDPATKDISLENVLRKNYSEGKEKIEKLYQKYVNKQEQGEDHVSSDDVDTSESSDSEENSKKTGKKKSNKNVKKKGVKKSGKATEKNSKNVTEDNNKEANSNEVEGSCTTEEHEKEEIKEAFLKECVVDMERVDEGVDETINENVQYVDTGEKSSENVEELGV